MKALIALALFFTMIVLLGLVDTATGEVVIDVGTVVKCPITSLNQLPIPGGVVTRSMKFKCGGDIVDSHADLWYGDMVGMMQHELATTHVGDELICNPARFITGIFGYRGETVYQCKPPAS